MKIRYTIYMLLLPLVVTSGQNETIISQKHTEIADSIRVLVSHGADSIVREAARQIDSIIEKPRLIVLQKDIFYIVPTIPDHGIYWYFKVYKYRKDTVFSHTREVKF